MWHNYSQSDVREKQLKQVAGENASKKASTFLNENKYVVSSFLPDSSAGVVLGAQKLPAAMEERPDEVQQQLIFGFLAIRENKSYLNHSKLGFLSVSVKSISSDKDFRVNPTGSTQNSLEFRKRLLLQCTHHWEHCWPLAGIQSVSAEWIHWIGRPQTTKAMKSVD